MKCTYCGSSRNIEQEYVIAQSKGGRKTVPACRICNRSKSDKQFMVWFREMKAHDLYRWKRIVEHNYRKRGVIAEKVRRVRDE